MWKKIEFILLFSIGLCFHSIAQQEIDAFFDSRPSEDSLPLIINGNKSFGKYLILCSGAICL